LAIATERRYNPRMRLGILAFALVLQACNGGSAGPTSTLDRYAEALKKKDYSRAYDMMSADFRAKYSREDFVRMMRDNPQEVRETAQRLEQGHRDVEVTAEFRYGLGDSMRLVREGDTWRIASDPVAFYSQATPREALRSFVRAYRLERWDIMLRFVPKDYREKMTVEKLREQFQGQHRDEIALMMNMIEANLDEPIDDKGNEARMPYGERFEVAFVREEGLWRIKDLN
jgi:hypothetical protein